MPVPPSPITQSIPGTQSPFFSQLEGHIADVPLHLSGAQSTRVLTHWPLLSHCLVTITVSVSHASGGLQVPPAGSLPPAGTGVHVPWLPAIAHELQLGHAATA